MSLNNGTLLNVVLRTKLLNTLDTEGKGGGGVCWTPVSMYLLFFYICYIFAGSGTYVNYAS